MTAKKPFESCSALCRYCGKLFKKTRHHHNCCSPECASERHDAYARRAATRERIAQNKAKAMQS